MVHQPPSPRDHHNPRPHGFVLLTIKIQMSDNVFEDRGGIVKIVDKEKVVRITDLFIDVVG
jgi:hypothetical protein